MSTNNLGNCGAVDYFPNTCRQEELTARLMGHSNPKLAGGLKMKAFNESPYGDDVVSELMTRQVDASSSTCSVGCAFQSSTFFPENGSEAPSRCRWCKPMGTL